MGDPVRLECSICGDDYYLHPANDRPIENADLCNTCAAFKKGMQGWNETVTRKNVTLGGLICGLSGICVLLVILWLMFGR